MNTNWLLILLPLAAVGGWLFSQVTLRGKLAKDKSVKQIVPTSFLTGLNQLLNQQDDQALKTFLTISQDQPELPELQLTLGRLSRRKGEFERATYIHQSILENNVYSDSTREMARYELAKDYYAAGLYDRAEELFLTLKNNSSQLAESIRYLLDIYQHEKDWLSAIDLLKQQSELEGDALLRLVHCYCERTEELIAKGEFRLASQCVNEASSLSGENPRIVTLLGKLAAHRGNHEEAVAFWKKLQWHEAHYLGEAIGHLNNSYEILGRRKEFIVFLKSAVRVNPDPRLISYLVDALKVADKAQSIKDFVKSYLHEKPTLGGIHQLMTNWLDLANHKLDQDTVLIVQSISKLIENERNYACLECGFSADKHHWQCPACQQWEVVKPSHLLNSPLSKLQLSKMPEVFGDVVDQPDSPAPYSAEQSQVPAQK